MSPRFYLLSSLSNTNSALWTKRPEEAEAVSSFYGLPPPELQLLLQRKKRHAKPIKKLTPSQPPPSLLGKRHRRLPPHPLPPANFTERKHLSNMNALYVDWVEFLVFLTSSGLGITSIKQGITDFFLMPS